MNLGENIYRLRGEKNMSQGDLADALEVSRQSVSKWENNSAVPELEKLVKLSELFGVTLDELVGKDKPQAPEPIVQTVYIRSSMPGRKIAGILLLCGAFLAFLLMAIFVDVLLGLFMAVALAVCGVICLVSEKNIGLKCGWALYLPCWAFTNVFMLYSIGTIASLVRVILLLAGAALMIATIRYMRSGKLSLSSGGKTLVTVLMALILLINVIGMLPLHEIQLDNPFIDEDESIVTTIESICADPQ